MLMAQTLGHGGTERQLAEIAINLDRARFQPHVGCVESEGFRADELRRAAVPIVEFPVTSLTNIQALRSAFQLRRYIREHHIDLIHAFDTGMNIFAIPTARLFGTPALSSQRCYEDTIWPPYRRAVHIAHRIADGVVANCEAMRRHLIENYAVPGRKIHVCYNGLDTEVFRPAPAARPEALRDAELVIGTVCVLRPEKGLSTLVDAFAQVSLEAGPAACDCREWAGAWGARNIDPGARNCWDLSLFPFHQRSRLLAWCNRRLCASLALRGFFEFDYGGNGVWWLHNRLSRGRKP